jgi:hypothetical protein
MDIIGTHKKENLITLEKYHIYIIGEMTYTWMTQRLGHITQYSEHCRKWAPVSRKHTLPLYIKTEPLHEKPWTGTHSTKERNQCTKRRK